MLKIAIITKNIYLEKAIEELTQEIASTKCISDLCFQSNNIKDHFKKPDIIFTEMEVGEYLLCQEMKKYKSECPAVVIFTKKEITFNPCLLPLCVQNAVILFHKNSLETIKKNLSILFDEFVAGDKKRITIEKNRCLKCPHQSLSRSQLKIINAINIGLNNNETAKNLGIDPRTVYSHKLRIMKKFQLENNQELIRFSSIVMRRTSLYFN